ncbi:Lrp/AsnC family transcriptional regulator [Streptacidiphilus fuscans]|uniref:AsnC family transcriptional regulator n=1 Tax=Streptacidiphilus fuscans TaxID=2789292 RepID=A0A931B305_9ACTN|nr:AsnC family transcriptional regulator [Streptacidiphilus fuscans]MBF9068347.1 AsnC family transcriptional regulator [Streptacidiphilus fuscans]
METDISARAAARAAEDGYDELDRQLVQALQLDSRAPFSRIAEVLGVSDQTVARRYARLRDRGSVRVLGLSEATALGEVRWHVRVQCIPGAAPAVADALARREDTTWVSLGSGGAEINCTTRAHPDAQHDNLLLQRLPRTPSVVGVSAHCVMHTYFGGAHSIALKSGALSPEQVAKLSPGGFPPPTGSAAGPGTGRGTGSGTGSATGPVSVDDADRRLFEVLAVDGRAGLTELAAATGWSASTVRRRMAELEAAGVLYFDLDMDWRIFGIRNATLLWLSVAPAELDVTGAALAEHYEVAYACATTGPTNLHAVVLTSDVQGFYTYLTTRIAALPAVRQVETAPVMRNVKGPGPVPLPLRGAHRPLRRAGS